jgi:hypothetical protein
MKQRSNRDLTCWQVAVRCWVLLLHEASATVIVTMPQWPRMPFVASMTLRSLPGVLVFHVPPAMRM